MASLMDPPQQFSISHARGVDVEDEDLEGGFREMMFDFIAGVECRNTQPFMFETLSQKASVGQIMIDNTNVPLAKRIQALTSNHDSSLLNYRGLRTWRFSRITGSTISPQMMHLHPKKSSAFP